MFAQIEWLFFDVGSTLADESKANEHRIWDAIGDRLDNDIAPAKWLGFKTIWIRQGFGGMGTPSSEQNIPDYCVNGLGELAVLLG